VKETIEMICYKERKKVIDEELIVVGLDLLSAIGPARCAGSGDKVS